MLAFIQPLCRLRGKSRPRCPASYINWKLAKECLGFEGRQPNGFANYHVVGDEGRLRMRRMSRKLFELEPLKVLATSAVRYAEYFSLRNSKKAKDPPPTPK